MKDRGKVKIAYMYFFKSEDGNYKIKLTLANKAVEMDTNTADRDLAIELLEYAILVFYEDNQKEQLGFKRLIVQYDKSEVK